MITTTSNLIQLLDMSYIGMVIKLHLLLLK